MSDNLNQPKDHTDRADWWFVDSNGRKIGYMWPEDIKAILESIWGKGQGIKCFAAYAGLTRTTVEKYCNGRMPVPKTVALLVLTMQELMLEKGAHLRQYPWRIFPKTEATWLPERRQDPTFKVATKPFG